MVMRDARRQRLRDLLEEAAITHGFELVDVELSGTKAARVIRVFLDRASGLTIDDLASANSWVDAVIEENEPYSGAYTLEVSSPGIDRPLRTLEHFARFAGEEVRLVSEPVDGRSKWTAVLAGVENDDIVLTVDGATVRVPYAKVKKAHVKGRIEFESIKQ
jgi:ribosome maturation factor RimP